MDYLVFYELLKIVGFSMDSGIQWGRVAGVFGWVCGFRVWFRGKNRGWICGRGISLRVEEFTVPGRTRVSHSGPSERGEVEWEWRLHGLEFSFMKSRPWMGVNSNAHFQILNSLRVFVADIAKKIYILLFYKGKFQSMQSPFSLNLSTYKIYMREIFPYKIYIFPYYFTT